MAMTIDEFFRSKRNLFWTLQLVGWSAWGTYFYMIAIVWGAPDRYIQYTPLAAALGLAISMGLRALYRHTWDFQPRARVAVGLFGSLGAALLWRLGRELMFGQLYMKEEKYPLEHEGFDQIFMRLPEYVEACFVMLCWTGLYFCIKYYQLLQEERRRGLRAETMAHEAQLKMLRYQLNPHFLFNTLNAISTLVLDKENGLANTMVTRLSHFLRYSLDNDPMQKVSLEQEIEAMKLYLDIEKVRFDERLQLEFEIEDSARQALIPSLLLQPLVENAIKYAIAQSVNGGTIRIAAQAFAGELLLEVTDDGPGMDPSGCQKSSRQGVGIENTRERLRELFSDNQSFQLSRTEPHGLTINIRIPLEKEAH